MAVREVPGDHPREKIMKTDNKKDKKVYLVAQEVKLARVLAGNNKTSRDRALKSLKKWFNHRSKTMPFTDNDFQIIWKGLYYSMWMSDKPLVQEECAESIASLVHFETVDESLLFFKAGLTILINEWFGIDQLRLDKFLMLVRRLLRQMLVALKQHGLSKKNINKFGEVLSYTVLNTEIHPPVGLFMHFTEIYLEEIAKITKGNVPSERVIDFVRPFIKKLLVTTDGRETAHLKKFIFFHLIKQSDLGIEYQVKYEAWKKEGFPGTINSMQKVKVVNDGADDSEGVVGEKPLDPRAGRVDVELPQIKFKPKDMAEALNECKFDKNSNSKSRKIIQELYNHFTKMAKGTYPLAVKRVLDAKKDSSDTNIRKATNRLVKFEKKLMGKDRKKKKRKISGDGAEETEEVPPKRKKLETKDDNINGKKSANGDDVTEEELEKFIARSESNTRKMGKKNTTKREDEHKDGNVEKSMRGDDVTEEELEKFIAQSEGGPRRKKGVPKKLSNVSDKNLKRQRATEAAGDTQEIKKKRRNKRKLLAEIIDNIECVFERNSGTWVVYDISKEKKNVDVPSTKTEVDKEHAEVISVKQKETPSTSSGTAQAEASGKSPTLFGADLGSPIRGRDTPGKTRASHTSSSPEETSPKSGYSPVHLFESSQKPKELFPKSAWDEPLQEGEYEICIPARKHVAKLKKRAKKTHQSSHELINTSMKQLRGKARLGLDASLVKNSFLTPAGAKKVKINTKLNKSQEIHEHVQQILSSPGIPYDASKKPLKPLLKTSLSSTPLNPFYNKQLSVCANGRVAAVFL